CPRRGGAFPRAVERFAETVVFWPGRHDHDIEIPSPLMNGTLLSLGGTSLASGTIEGRGLMHSSRRSVLAVIRDSRQAELFDTLLADSPDHDMIVVESI